MHHSFRRVFCLTLALFAAMDLPCAFAHEEVVILVGRTAVGQLKVELEFEEPIELPPTISPAIPGYFTGELALHSTLLDEPDKDLFQLSPASNFRFVLLAKDAGMEVWNDMG